jgi:hypothetical protein
VFVYGFLCPTVWAWNLVSHTIIDLTFGTGVLHLIQINHQHDAIIFQFIILIFDNSSACFGRFPAHHQELNDCSGSLWFYLRIVVTVVLCSWSGRPAVRPDHEHSTTITTIRRWNQRLPLQSLSSWWWEGKRPKHAEQLTNVRIINWKTVASVWWFIWIAR